MKWIQNKNNQGKLSVALTLFLAMAAVVLLPIIFSISQTQSQVPSVIPGQSATLLSDGRWLLIGGESVGGSLSTVSIWNPLTGTTTEISSKLQHARSWHSATMLPDGTILILGGVGANGQVVQPAELFNPETQNFSVLPSSGLHGRARHTANLLTDGHVLIAGGIGNKGEVLSSSELFDYDNSSSVLVAQPLSSPRRNHTATLLPDGRVLLWGGSNSSGEAQNNGEIFDQQTSSFTPVTSYPTSLFPSPGDGPTLVESIPPDKTIDVPSDAIVALRFSKPLRAESINTSSVTLSGPNGIEKIKIVAAEEGRLAFITPEELFLSGSTYSVTINGAVDRDGLLLPLTAFSFAIPTLGAGTRPSALSSPQSLTPKPDTQDSKPQTERETPDDGWTWTGALKDGKPHSPWQDLPPLKAPPGVTALAGQALDLRGLPLSNVTIIAEGHYGGETHTARTDKTGRFLIQYADPGWNELVIDGRHGISQNLSPEPLSGKWGYGVYEYGLRLKKGETNILPFTIWLTPIDGKNAVKIDSPTTSETIVTSPKIPGLELRLPPTTVIFDHEWKIVKELSLTPIPLDRTPFPLPPNVQVPLYFTAQPGGAYVTSSIGVGARIHYPNSFSNPPGLRADFWHYDANYRGWYIYGRGRVSQDGTQVVPDAGISVYELTGAMVSFPGNPAALGKKCRDSKECEDGEPVDLQSGLFIQTKTDLIVPDVLPITLTRTYRNEDSFSRTFGRGTTHPYEMFLTGDSQNYTWIELILPDGGRVRYDRINAGNDFPEAILEASKSPTFYKSRITWNGTGWDLRLKDGTVYVFGENAPLQSIRDRFGNQVTITRASGQVGNITRLTASPSGRWIEFRYDTSNRITQARDNIGRTVNYEYDGGGRLWKVTDPMNGVTEYTYDANHRMLTIKDPRGIVFLTNQYDSNGRVIKQTQADGTTFLFSYTESGGNIVQADVTDPRGNVKRTEFNTDGQLTKVTKALGKPEEQVINYERQTTTNLLLSVTDALEATPGVRRKTAYAYDTFGNVLTVTRMAQDSPNSVTTTYTYTLNFSQVATIRDPLNHTTTFGYDSIGNLTSIQDPLGNLTTFTYNASGQPVSVSPPAPAGTTEFVYEFGDLVSIIDPLGNTTNRTLDFIGRLKTITNPLGLTTGYNYDNLNRLTQVTDALNGLTQFGYDPNGNLTGVTDAKASPATTSYTYDSMDRLQTRTDPLSKVENYLYDNNGNLIHFRDRKHQATLYEYDALNRRTKVSYGDFSSTNYTYDKGNRLTQINDSISGLITRSYDGLDRLTSETTPQGSVSYTYDNASRRTTMTVSGQSSVVYSYDNANRLTQITQGSSTVTFGYDNANRRTSLTLPNNILVEYAYDAASRVTGITYKQNGTTVLGNLTYEYDKAGNRTNIGGTWARTGMPQNVTTTSYDANNRQLTFGDKTLTYDDNGNLQSITDSNGTALYTWNARNQLVGISGPGVNASFVYDGLGRREKKTINSSLTEFLYDGVNPVQETSGAAVMANMLTGPGIDEFFTRTDVPAGVTSNLLADALGSTIALADSSGVLQIENTYEPFGKTTVTGSSNTNPFQYTGRENDGTGLYYYRARYYHPGLQRFTSEDPIGFVGGDVNLYAYVRNRSINATDPMGLWAPWYHMLMTKRVAKECGMSDIDAAVLARANHDMDFSFWPFPSLSTLNPRSMKHGMPKSIWQAYFAAEFSIARTTGSLQALGAALHTLQDAHAHDLAGVGMLDHLNPFYDPDDPTDPRNRERANQAEKATEKAIREFMKARGFKPTC